MKIGYPCINRSLSSGSGHTFRLASFIEARFMATVEMNLAGLREILEYNRRYGLQFLRISSGLIPFASHPVCTIRWWERFATTFSELGKEIRDAECRITMHPDQFTLLNSPEPRIVTASTAELLYHARVLDALELDRTAKIQIHVGGVYGDKPAAMQRFAAAYRTLPEPVRRRLVLENDDHLYALADVVALHRETGTPVLFDFFHHRLHHHGETVLEALALATATYTPADGLLLTDYSSQEPGARPGTHAETLVAAEFIALLEATRPFDFDIMLEIKDKEKSALRAMQLARRLPGLPLCDG